MRRIIFAVLVIWMAFGLAPVFAQQGVTYYVNVKAAKVRTEPKTTAKLITTLGRGKSVVVFEVVIGEIVSNVDTWYKVKISGKDGYILSSLLTDRKPVVASSGTTTSSSNNNTSSVPPTSSPIPPVIRAVAGCGGATTCGQMASCDQAYACLNAGDNGLDRDNDGVPCESICPGG